MIGGGMLRYETVSGHGAAIADAEVMAVEDRTEQVALCAKDRRLVGERSLGFDHHAQLDGRMIKLRRVRPPGFRQGFQDVARIGDYAEAKTKRAGESRERKRN